MKNNLVLIFMIFFITLSGCTNGMNNKQKEIDYIVKSGAKIYSYNFDIKNLDQDVSISTLEEVKYSNNYTIIVFENKTSYQGMNASLVTKIYQNLSLIESVMILFIDYPDFNFFKGTEFSNEKDFYPSRGYVEGYYNFGIVKGITSFNYNIDTATEEIKMEYAIINILHRSIKEDIGNQ